MTSRGFYAQRYLRNWVWMLISLFILPGCQGNQIQDELHGRVTLWHSWPPAEAAELDADLARFEEIHPGVQIITLSLPENQFLEELITAGQDGLGPALFLGKDEWISDLAERGVIRPLETDDFPDSLFNRRNRTLTQYEGQIYGVPLSLAPRALYYNKNLVTTPPDTLEELLTEAADGRQIAFVPRFEEAYWGIQTYGDGLFNDEGQITLEGSGFEEWLVWLNDAQNAPGIILDLDDPSLLNLFAGQQIAYYVAPPDRQQLITTKMDEENPFDFGIATLPGGESGPSGPILEAETIMFYPFTSAKQKQIANALALFLVNQQQSIHFMRDLNRVPANPTVRVDQRIYPFVHGFAQQARTSLVIPNEVPQDLLVMAGNRAYASALSGLLTPAEAVCSFGEEVAAGLSTDAFEVVLPAGCGGENE